MYPKSIRPSAKREVQKERNAQLDDRIARPRRAQTCELRAKRAMRMCPGSGQIFLIQNGGSNMVDKFKKRLFYLFNTEYEYVCKVQKYKYKNSINLFIRSFPQLILYRFVEKCILNTMQVIRGSKTSNM